MSYSKEKTELRYTEHELKDELEKLEAKDLVLKKVTELASIENSKFKHTTLDRIYEAATHTRVLRGFEIERIKIILRLSDKLDLNNVRKTSLKEQLAMLASKRDLQKIRDQAKSYKYNKNNTYNTFNYLDASMKIVNSFVDFCYYKGKELSPKDQESLIEQNFKQLLEAQTLLDSQIHERAKVKKTKITK